MNKMNKVLAALVVVAFAVAVLPNSGAQTTTDEPFGTQVDFGDNDFVPTLAATADVDGGAGVYAAGDVVFCRVALADTTTVTDDGYYLIPYAATPAAVPATLPTNAVRIAGTVSSMAAGSLTQDADTQEVGKACAAVGPTGTGAALAAGGAFDVFFANFDPIAGYTSGDCVYLDADNSGTLTRWDVRLSACTVGQAYNAGTLVELGDQDLVNIGGNAAALPAATQFGIWDSQPNGVFDGSDRLYLQQAAITQPGVNDIRLAGADFGSKVAIGGGDFLPNLAGLAAFSFCRVNLNDQSLVTDDGYYLVPAAAAAAGTVLVNSIRLTSVMGKAAGTQVADADTTERGAGCVGGSTAIPFGPAGGAATGIFAVSFDQIGAYTAGDCLYLNADASDTGAPLWTLTRYDIRLTSCMVGSTTYNAGSLVDLGDQDLVNTPGAIAGPAGIRFFDSQPNTVIDNGDRVYVSATANPAINDVRLFGGTFGDRVSIGDDDFIPTLAGLPAGPNFCRVALNDTSLVTDDGYYLMPAAQGTLATNSIRLTAVAGHEAGTVVTDAHTTERGQPCVDLDGAGLVFTGTDAIGFGAPAGGAYNVFAVSFDQIAGYSAGDCVYLDSGASGATGGMNRWDVRLTDCTIGGTTLNAGTLVELGDQDLVNIGAGAVNPAGAPAAARFWDAQPNGVVDGNDRIYLSTAAAATRPQLNDVRIIGDFSTSTNPGGGQPNNTPTTTTTTTTGTTTTTTVTTTDTTTVTTTTTGTSPTTTTGTTPTDTTTGPGGTDTETNPSPGIELVALVGALAVALFLVRRKL